MYNGAGAGALSPAWPDAASNSFRAYKPEAPEQWLVQGATWGCERWAGQSGRPTACGGGKYSVGKALGLQESDGVGFSEPMQDEFFVWVVDLNN